VASVRKGGSVTLVGNLAQNVDFPLQSVVTRQIRVQGSCASSGEYPACIDLMSKGAIRVDPLISAVAPLEEGPSWFDRLYRHKPNLMKVILRPGVKFTAEARSTRRKTRRTSEEFSMCSRAYLNVSATPRP
jgi:L-iditol 2-dehydrogenase